MRTITSKLLELAEAGAISWETIARECLAYMSEAEVSDMAHSSGMLDEDEEDEEDEDEEDEEDAAAE